MEVLLHKLTNKVELSTDAAPLVGNFLAPGFHASLQWPILRLRLRNLSTLSDTVLSGVILSSRKLWSKRIFPRTASSFGTRCLVQGGTRRGYTVRPSSLPLEGASSPGQEEQQSQVSNFHALRIPFKFDTDGISSPNWSPPAREETSFALDEGPNLHIHRVTCNQDFPSTWQPARRIVTFMGLVSLACTLLVVAIILIAVALSRGSVASHGRLTTTSSGAPDLVHLIPTPRRFHNRTPTIVVHRQNSKIWRRHADDLTVLLKAYKDRQTSATSCDLHYAPIGVSSCSFPLDRISDNCTSLNSFGYTTGNPCVALVFNAFMGWSPTPLNVSDLPADLRTGDQDPHLLRVSCNASTLDVRYSPFPGFPARFLSGHASNLPPLVMVQFLGHGAAMDVEVVCTLWAKNLPKNEDGHIRFSLFII